MKIADLYIRVSTDEQADKGYSQRSQEEVLRKYCEINKISVRKAIYEDHSAKTFIRPQWQSMLVNLKKYRNKIAWYFLPNGTVSAVMRLMPTR